nr:unnamed protein product [Ipomoea batatas]
MTPRTRRKTAPIRRAPACFTTPRWPPSIPPKEVDVPFRKEWCQCRSTTLKDQSSRARAAFRRPILGLGGNMDKSQSKAPLILEDIIDVAAQKGAQRKSKWRGAV